MTAQTTTQRTAKHRLAVKERMARMESALWEIAGWDIWDVEDAHEMRLVAVNAIKTPTTTPKTPK